MFKLYCIFGCLCAVLLTKTSAQFGAPKCPNPVSQQTCPHPDIKWWHYNKAVPFGQLLRPGRPSGAFFNTPMPIVVLIHSYTGNRDATPNCQLRPHFIERGGVNVISIDYSTLVPYLCYKEAVENAHLVGRCLSTFLLTFLRRGKILPHNIHLIGFGLGAHVAGFAAKFLMQSNFRVGHITGLDPAKPHFQVKDPSMRLDKSDADFVDVIHTDIFVHGLMMPIGHVDFYPNGGTEQPNCGYHHEMVTHACYHNRAAEFYAESIFTGIGFNAFRCEDLISFISDICQPNDNTQVMGYHVPRHARGCFFLKTNSFTPYARGYNFENLDRTLFGVNYYGFELRDKLQEWYIQDVRTDITVTSTIIIDVMPIECNMSAPICL